MNRRDALRTTAALGLFSLGIAPRNTVMAQEATPESVPSGTGLERMLTSNIDSLPAADDGEVQVVVQSAPFDTHVGFIVHNNGSEPVGVGNVIGVGRNAEDELTAVTRSSHSAPYEIAPGDYSIGVVSFDGSLDPDGTVELALDTEEIDSRRNATVDLTVTEISVTDDRIIGIVENQSETETDGLGHMIGLFLDDAGEIVGLARPYISSADLAPGEFTTFSERLDAGVFTDAYLFAALGREAR